MRALLGLVLVSGCVSTNTVVCDDGTVCAADSHCIVVQIGSTPTTYCVSPDQRASCDGLADQAACVIDNLPGTCRSGACLPSSCGNQLLDANEACDDGNTEDRDGCSHDCSSMEVCGNKVVDTEIGEQCDLGDPLSHDGCASTCIDEAATTDVIAPAARPNFAAAYDVARRTIVVFGGNALGSATYHGETLEWDGVRWHASSSVDQPQARLQEGMAYDAARGQVVMFSGAPLSSDTWTYDGTWRHHELSDAPTARFSAGMAYDAGRKVVVLFGGSNYYLTADPQNSTLGDAWEWDGAAWHERASTQLPQKRFLPGMAYDPKRGVIVMYGGAYGDSGGQHVLGDLWEYDGTTWAQKLFSGTNPGARLGPVMAFDPVTQRVMLVGGTSPAGNSDAFEWDGASWTQLASVPNTVATGVSNSGLVADPVRGRVVLIDSDPSYSQFGVHEWDGTSWSQPAAITSAQNVTARRAAGSAFDSKRGQLVMFGGATGAYGGEVADTWIWDGAWYARSPSGTPPSARSTPAMAYDAGHDEVVLFGGGVYDGAGCGCDNPQGETWILKNGAWAMRTPVSEPGPRRQAAMVYDAERGQIVLFGGVAHDLSGFAVLLDETWTWNGTTWHQEAPAHKPSSRGSPAMAYDPIRKRVVLFGGEYGVGTAYDTWTWDGLDWTRAVDPGGPPPRSEAGLAWDSARQRLVLTSGSVFVQTGSILADDVWEWDGAHWYFVAPSSVGPRTGAIVASSTDGAGVIVIGGIGAGGMRDDVQRIRWNAGAPAEACVDLDTDGDGLAGCADPDCWWRCNPACPPNTACASAPLCGDGTCDATREACTTCPGDCGACSPHCGDFACQSGETAVTCPGDCGP